MDDYGIPRTQKGLFANVWAWIIATTLMVVIVFGVGRFAFDWFAAGPKGQLQARQQILSGANRIQAYNHFFDLCASVQTSESALDASYAELSTAKGADADRVRTNITAQRINRAEAVNQYNQDARKSYTIGQFRSLQLPFQLDLAYTKGVHTTCAA